MVTIRVREDLVNILLEIVPEAYTPYARMDNKGKNIFILQ